MLFWNCRHGMLAKLDIISYYLDSYAPELLFVSEAELQSNKDYSCLSVSGYCLEVSKTIKEGKARQAAYIKVGSKFKRRLDLEDGLSEVMVFADRQTRICGVYRPFKPPAGKTLAEAFDLMLECLNKVTMCGAEVIIGGDFNVNWHANSPKKKKLEMWAESSGLHQGINEMTRHQVESTAVGTVLKESCIDLIFQMKPRKVDIVPSLGSDHDVLVVSLEVEKTVVKTKKKVSIDWRNYDSNQVAAKFNRLPVVGGSNLQTTLDSVNSNLIVVLNEWAPKRIIRLRGENNFENCRIEAMKKRRDRAWKKFKKYGQFKHYELSKSLSLTLKKLVKKRKEKSVQGQASKSWSQEFLEDSGGNL